MLLLTGPAGSGKTSRILERFRDALRRRDAGVRLLTPTATMAQHLQNQLAREGFVFRPGMIQTLSRFVDAFAGDEAQVSEPLFYLVVETAASRVNRPEFARVVRLPGFCAALARTMEELSSAGCDADRLADSMARRGRWAMHFWRSIAKWIARSAAADSRRVHNGWRMPRNKSRARACPRSTPSGWMDSTRCPIPNWRLSARCAVMRMLR